jgi:ubiquinone/menaquinone biosynthesis C-methylase UbiE
MTSTERERGEVPEEFDRIARSYDVLTGMNPGYRRHLRMSAERLAPRASAARRLRLLDLCCGTGLSTDALVRRYPDADVVGLDASAGMLAHARDKKGLGHVRFVLGDAMDPRAAGVTGAFDGVLMAYGIRNVPDRDLCLARIVDLLRPGGRLCLHEYSVAGSPRAVLVWNAVTLGVIIPGGLLTAGTTRIYRYLRRSVLDFDSVPALQARLRRAGLANVRTEPMDGWQRGIVHSFLAERPL